MTDTGNSNSSSVIDLQSIELVRVGTNQSITSLHNSIFTTALGSMIMGHESRSSLPRPVVFLVSRNVKSIDSISLP